MPNILSVLPEILLIIIALLFFLIDKYRANNTPKTFYSLSKYGLFFYILGEITLQYFHINGDLFHNTGSTIFYKIILSISAWIIFSMSCKWFLSKNLNSALFYGLSLWLLSALSLILSSANLGLIGLGIVLSLLIEYKLSVIFNEEDTQSEKKYGIFSIFVLLMMFVSLYYFGQKISGLDVVSFIKYYKSSTTNIFDKMAYMGLLLSLIYLIGIFPLHAGKVQIHQNSILPSSAVIQILPMFAGYGSFVYLSKQTGIMGFEEVYYIIELFAFLSIFVGALSLIRENNLKVIISYSSLYAVGVSILTLKNFDKANELSSLIYLIIFMVSILGIYGILFCLKSKGEYLSELSSVQGLYSQKPMLAVLLCIFLMSIAGMPLSLGFVGKLQIVDSFVLQEEYWVMFFFFMAFFLILIAYLNIISQVFFSEKSQHLDRINNGSVFWISVFIVVFLIGILNPAFYIENLEKILR